MNSIDMTNWMQQDKTRFNDKLHFAVLSILLHQIEEDSEVRQLSLRELEKEFGITREESRQFHKNMVAELRIALVRLLALHTRIRMENALKKMEGMQN